MVPVVVQVELYIPKPTVTNVASVFGAVRPAGRGGRAEAGTVVAVLRKGDAKQTVTRRSGRSDRASIVSYTDGGKGVNMG